MAERARPALGLSIGATNLAGVTADQAVIRKPVLTLYHHRPPEVGVPSENPRLDRPGLVITDFVDRVGDPVGIVAADGSVHRSEELIAEALRALAYAATGAHALPDDVAISYPAHWGSAPVDALGAAVSRVAEWSDRAHPLTLIPDAAATLFAARANPGIPARGTVVVCDFGGSGTSVTLMDAAGAYHPLAPTVRHHDFSGDLIDQALLTAVMANMPSTGSFDPSGTSAIGALSRLRTECRSAKEQLSSNTVATLTGGPGTSGDVRITRNELDDAIRESLNGFVAVVDECLARNGIRDLVAVVSVGGGANIPAVTTMLSGHFRVPVVTTPRPQLTAAIGGALRATRGPEDTSATMLTPPVSATALAPVVAPVSEPRPGSTGMTLARPSEPASGLMPALAWAAVDDSRAAPVATGEQLRFGEGSGYTGARPALSFERPARPRSEPEPKAKVMPWYRLPGVVAIATAVAILIVGMAVALGLSSGNNSPGVGTTPASAPASPAPVNGASPQPAPPSAVPENGQPAAPAQQAPPPAAVDSNPPAADTPAAPAPEAPAPPPAPPVPPAVPHIPQIPQIPPIPRIPGI